MGYFSEALSEDDLLQFGFQRGCNKGQQTWEALAALVALRLWRPLWKDRRIQLAVRTDNMTVASMVGRLKAGSPGLRLIAAEMALDLAASCYMPSVVEHTPGIQHVIADALSRTFDPEHSGEELPAALQGASRCIPPRRGEEFYLSLRTPDDASSRW